VFKTTLVLNDDLDSTIELHYEQYGHQLQLIALDRTNTMNNPTGCWAKTKLLEEFQGSFSEEMIDSGLVLFVTNHLIVEHENCSTAPHHEQLISINYSGLCTRKNLVAISTHSVSNLTDSHFVATLVRAIAHAWGAGDEMPTAASRYQGHFVMTPPVHQSPELVGGNNLRFSLGTVRQITEHIYKVERNEQLRCFRRKLLFGILIQSNSFTLLLDNDELPRATCGNHVVEPGEECDDPSTSPGPWSNCCTAKCTLVRYAQCSPFHHLGCGTDCRVQPPHQVCIPQDVRLCLAESRSNGLDRDCPRLKASLPDGSQCEFNRTFAGVCFQGRCHRDGVNLSAIIKPHIMETREVHGEQLIVVLQPQTSSQIKKECKHSQSTRSS